MPSGGSVPTDVGTTLARIGSAAGVFLAGAGGLFLLLRWLTGDPVRRRRAPAPDVPRRRPLEAVAADLRRLSRELAAVPSGAPMARRRGLLAAYDDVLVEAADLLEVPHALRTVPSAGRELERIRLLGALEAAGLVVSG